MGPARQPGNQIENYLDLINIFRHIIRTYTTLAALPEAIRKTTILAQNCWTWTQQAFEALKNILVQATFLSFPDFNATFRIATDASYVGS